MQFASSLLSLVQLAALAWMVMGADAVCRFVGLTTRPAWMNSVEQNSMPYAILVFIVLPQFVSSFTLTGAFELILDNRDEQPIFSKLQAGRFPTQEELIAGFQAAGLKQAS